MTIVYNWKFKVSGSVRNGVSVHRWIGVCVCAGCTCTPPWPSRANIFGQYLAIYIQEPSLRPCTERHT